MLQNLDFVVVFQATESSVQTSDGYPLGPVAYTETCSERFYHQHVQVSKMEVLTHVSSM